MRILPSIPVILSFCLLVAPLGASDIHVNSVHGSDATGTGAVTKPWRTITKGLSLALAGDTLRIAPGTYDYQGQEIFPLVVKAGVSLVGTGGMRDVFIVSTSPWSAAMKVAASGPNPMHLANFTLLGGWTGLEILGQGGLSSPTSLTISGVAVENAGDGLILTTDKAMASPGVLLTLDSCMVRDHWGRGISCSAAKGQVRLNVRNSVITDNGQDGIIAWPLVGTVKFDLTLLHCTVARNQFFGLRANALAGLTVKVDNSILCENRSGALSGVDSKSLFHCLLSPGTNPGSNGNKIGDPDLLRGGDWHLGHKSAAIGLGDPKLVASLTHDPDGQLRPVSGAVDAGADQRVFNTLVTEERGLRSYRNLSFRTFTHPGAMVVLFISDRVLSPGYVINPIQGSLQLNFFVAMETVMNSHADGLGVVDLKIPIKFNNTYLHGLSVGFQAACLWKEGSLVKAGWTNPIEPYFIQP